MEHDKEHFEKGKQTEREQLSLNGLAKNHSTIHGIDPRTGLPGSTIPDAFKNEGKSTTEIKNVIEQTLTRQLRLQERFSKENGFVPELIINDGAQMSRPLLNSAFVIKTYPNVTHQQQPDMGFETAKPIATVNSIKNDKPSEMNNL